MDTDFYFTNFRTRTNQFANWTWDNIISAIDVKKNNYQIFEKTVDENIPDYTVKTVIGGKEYKFEYGAYHNIWLNTNEDEMIVDVYPAEVTRVEFWTGYHPGQGRRILLDRKRYEVIVDKGIIRSLRVILVRHLKKKDYQSKHVNLSDNSIGKDYQKHIGMREERIKHRQVYHKDYKFHENPGIIEIFDQNKKKTEYLNQILFFVTILYIVIKI